MPVTNVKSEWVSGNLVFYDKDMNIIFTVDGTNRKVTIPSGSTLEALGTNTITDATLSPNDMALAEGNILVGDAAGKAVALSAKTTTQVIVGNGTTVTSVALSGDATMGNTGVVAIGSGVIVDGDVNASAAIAYSKLAALASARLLVGSAGNVATAVDVTGDVTISNTGVTAIGPAKVTAAMLVNNAAGLNSVGMGASASYAKTTNGVQTLATGTAGAKTCLFVVSVTETFVTNGGGNEQPTFKFGEVGTDDKFAVAALLTDATVGQIKVFPGALTAATNVICTATAKAGTGAGAIAVSVIILPTAS